MNYGEFYGPEDYERETGTSIEDWAKVLNILGDAVEKGDPVILDADQAYTLSVGIIQQAISNSELIAFVRGLQQ